MPEFLGRLRTPRLAAAPSSPQTGEMYYDTSTNKLMWWDGTQWIGSISGPPGPSGPAGSVEVYSQPTTPASTTVGAMWIDTDENPPTGGVHIGTTAPDPAIKQVWIDTDEPNPAVEAPHYVGQSGEPAFVNSWTNYDAPRAAYFYKDRERVYLGGLIKSGASGSIAFTLPVGYRPMTQDNLHYIVEASPNTPAECRIAPVAGTVMATNIGASSVTAWFSLEGLHFRAA